MTLRLALTAPATRLFQPVRRAVLAIALGAFGLVAITTVLNASAPPVTDIDIWWIAAAGRRMLQSHHVPISNDFSFVDGGHPWVMHEWLFGPIYTEGLTRWGPRFFTAVALVSCLAALALLLMGTLGRMRDRLAAAVLALIGLVCFDGRLGDVRPLGVVTLFPMAVVLLCFQERLTRWRLVGLVACEWVWANAHGSFVLGLALMAASAAAYVEDRRRRLAALAVATLATLANPYGLRLHALVAGYLLGREGIYRVIRKAIIEFYPLWRVPGYAGPAALVGLSLLGAFALALLAGRATRIHGALALGLCLLAVSRCRHLEIGALTAMMVISSAADRAMDRRVAGAAAPLGAWALLLLGLPALCGVLAQVRLPRASPGAWVSRELGAGALYALMPEVPDRGKLYAPFVVSGLAIWLGDPRGIRVLYDARNDPYRPEVAWAALTLEIPQPAAIVQSRLDRFGVEEALAPEGGWLAREVQTLPSWRALGRAEGWVLLARMPPAPR